MKIIDRRCGWSVEGRYTEALPQGVTVTPEQMYAYFGIEPGHRHYDEHSAPNKYDRIVLQKPDGNFVIVPINPDIYLIEV